ncbi:MAG: bifunctional pyr operon transcriptional regulator/uracil phosphoribosyltransferase PyrR [Pseudomonadota bacterium]
MLTTPPTLTAPPDAEALYAELLAQVGRAVAAQTEPPLLIGIYSGGAWLAQRLHADLQLAQPYGVVSSTFHRDDFATRGLHPSANRTALPVPIVDRAVLLIDDVLHTGRTTRAAINELFDFGRPARIDLAVLVDRGGRELPICPQIAAATFALPDTVSLALLRDEDVLDGIRFRFDLVSK